MEKEPRIQLIQELTEKCNHLAANFGSGSDIREAYLKIKNLVTEGKSLPEAIDIVDSQIFPKQPKSQS